MLYVFGPWPQVLRDPDKKIELLDKLQNIKK